MSLILKARVAGGWYNIGDGVFEDPVVPDRIADTLTPLNTGVPAGTALATQSGMTLTSANNGGSWTNKRITSRVTLSNINGFTFNNCFFDFHDWTGLYAAVGDASSNVVCNYCTFDGGSNRALWPGGPDQDMILVEGSGIHLFRCYLKNFDNAFRMRSNCIMEECRVEFPTLIPGAHLDGIEMYGSQDGIPCVNNKILKNHLDARAWVGGVPGNDIPGGGGVTAPLNMTCDFSSLDGIVMENNNLFGGSFNAYIRPHPTTPTRVPTHVEFIGNHGQGYAVDGGSVVTLDSTSTTRIKYWSDNIDKGVDGSLFIPYPIPGLGTDRPRP